MSHWHNIWLGGKIGEPSHGIASWLPIGTWNFNAPEDQNDVTAIIDQTVEKGPAFARWLQNVISPPPPLGQIPIKEARYTLTSNNPQRSDRRVHIEASGNPKNYVSVQDLQFTTPIDVPVGQRCGKVVFSDMHVSSGSTSRPDVAFPMGCNNGDLTPQEKALAFILFDISSCVGVIQ
jgi:hypothetical protein